MPSQHHHSAIRYGNINNLDWVTLESFQLPAAVCYVECDGLYFLKPDAECRTRIPRFIYIILQVASACINATLHAEEKKEACVIRGIQDKPIIIISLKFPFCFMLYSMNVYR